MGCGINEVCGITICEITNNRLLILVYQSL